MLNCYLYIHIPETCAAHKPFLQLNVGYFIYDETGNGINCFFFFFAKKRKL